MNGRPNPRQFPATANGFIHTRQPLHIAQPHPFTGDYSATSPRAADQLLPHGGGGANLFAQHVSGKWFL